MTQNYIAQIMIGGWNFAPINTAFCNGQLIAISQNEALYTLVGTTYGGNGTTTFALPNLQGCAVTNIGQGPGLSNYDLGQTFGVVDVTLNTNQIPVHNHTVTAFPATTGNYNLGPTANGWIADDSKGGRLFSADAPNQTLAQGAIANTGSSQPHDNEQPFQVLNFVIVEYGIFPSRN